MTTRVGVHTFECVGAHMWVNVCITGYVCVGEYVSRCAHAYGRVGGSVMMMK